MSPRVGAAAAPAGARGDDELRLGLPITLSAALHGAALAAALLWRPDPPPPQPPIYNVRLEAAPPGERAIGTVTPTPPAPTPPAPDPTPAPPRAETKPTDMPMPAAKPTPPPRKPAPPATPSLPTPKTAAKPTPTPRKPVDISPQPAAGGGPTGGRGTDVANVDISNGITFPYPGYLQNIVRQIAINFKPRNPRAQLQATVSFLIHRDGSVSEIRVVKGSGNIGFDLEAQGAIEAAGSTRAFGALPQWFKDDVLPVTFSFDPAIFR